MIFNKTDEIFKDGNSNFFIGEKYGCQLADGSIVSEIKLIEVRTGLDKFTNTAGYEFIVDLGEGFDELVIAIELFDDSLPF